MRQTIEQLKQDLAYANRDLRDALAAKEDADVISELRAEVEEAQEALNAALASTNESYEPMKLLKEMYFLEEAKKVPLKKAAKSVYHRDYLRTKNKPYRKYDPKKHERNKGDAE